ncbi:MAG TPA: methyltransferase domain-containing protein [Solirubrobacteraceae bacterium]|nr:methyltransferase domain-containing protein [Solirubrobacteraceae bacterium]
MATSTLRKRLRQARRQVRSTVMPVVLAGSEVQCPVCRSEFRRFHGRVCPRCLSAERQRLVWMYLEHTGILDEPLTVLHVAPEPAFRERLLADGNVTYVGGDLDPRNLGGGLERVDVTGIEYPDDHFDRVIVNHVLEHVPDDMKALRQILRVLRPGGRLITQHPVDYERETTYEDPSITSEEERERHFGQHDHVRVYGRDFEDRLRAAGFDVTVVDFHAQLTGEQVRRHGVAPRVIYDCAKPAA